VGLEDNESQVDTTKQTTTTDADSQAQLLSQAANAGRRGGRGGRTNDPDLLRLHQNIERANAKKLEQERQEDRDATIRAFLQQKKKSGKGNDQQADSKKDNSSKNREENDPNKRISYTEELV
jgi:hypothetical protein